MLKIKTIGAALFTASALLLSSCVSQNVNGDDNDFLVAKSLELTNIMDGLAQSKWYTGMTTQDEIEEIVSGIASYDYEEPEGAIVVRVPEETLDSIMDFTAGGVTLEEDILKYSRKRIASAVPAMINGRNGVVWLAASSVLAVDKPYHKPQGFSGAAYVVLFYENVSSITVFTDAGDDILSANSLFNNTFTGDDILSANSLFNTLTGDEITEISNEFLSSGYLGELPDIDGVEIYFIDKEDIGGL